MVESSDKMWSTGEGNSKPVQSSCLENPMNSMKRSTHKYLLDLHTDAKSILCRNGFLFNIFPAYAEDWISLHISYSIPKSPPKLQYKPNKKPKTTQHYGASCCYRSSVAKLYPTLLHTHGLYPTRILHPWDFPGKNTEVVWHSLFQWTTFCQNSPPCPICLRWPYMAWLIVSLS